jgi:hypothetical protein
MSNFLKALPESGDYECYAVTGTKAGLHGRAAGIPYLRIALIARRRCDMYNSCLRHISSLV